MIAWLRRLTAYISRRRLDDELADEIQLHIELRRQALIVTGWIREKPITKHDGCSATLR